MDWKGYFKSLVGALSLIAVFVDIIVLVCAVTSDSSLANTSTFLWSATVSGTGMCVSLGITFLRLVPNIYDRALERYPKGILIEVGVNAALGFFYITMFFDNLARSTKSHKCLYIEKKAGHIQVDICISTIISYFSAIGCATYGVLAFLSFRRWKQMKMNIDSTRQESYSQEHPTISSIIL